MKGAIIGAEPANASALQVILGSEATIRLSAYHTICSVYTALLLSLVFANIARAPRHQSLDVPVPAIPTTDAVSPAFETPTLNSGSFRGALKATASSGNSGRSVESLLAAQARAASASAPLSGRRKAVLIGLNYSQCQDKGLHLRYAAQDAKRFEDSLMKLGYSSEDMRVVTDEEGRPSPSDAYLIECMSWLVKGVSEGDRLFFVFSGHCKWPIGSEPYLVVSDSMRITRSTFQQYLVTKVPAGVELTIVLDCCHAASMVELKYCIGRMEYEQEATQTVPVVARRNIGGIAGPSPSQKFTFGSPSPNSQFTFGSSSLRRNRGIVAAPLQQPAPVPDRESASSITSFVTDMAAEIIGSPSVANFPASINPRRGRLVMEGRPLRHFEERKNYYVPTSGKVIFWAGTGERQLAFEATRGVENGIITDAICSVLDSIEKSITQRDIWHSIVGAVDKENARRKERDSTKPHGLRVQCAQLWVSQQETLNTPSTILSQSVFT